MVFAVASHLISLAWTARVGNSSSESSKEASDLWPIPGFPNRGCFPSRCLSQSVINLKSKVSLSVIELPHTDICGAIFLQNHKPFFILSFAYFNSKYYSSGINDPVFWIYLLECHKLIIFLFHFIAFLLFSSILKSYLKHHYRLWILPTV